MVMILISMNMMMKRGIQGMIKSVADQVGSQINAEQGFSDAGHLESQYVSTRTSVSKTTRELLGVTNYIYDS
ncbi:MAG: hypothetical protein KAR31_00920, partial [Candidatus Omnitrophica bacterium]|nr:hypothetical protein [Candidatus Omnitrophota bacterium]